MAGKPGRSLCKAVALLLNLLELAAQLDQLLALIHRQRGVAAGGAAALMNSGGLHPRMDAAGVTTELSGQIGDAAACADQLDYLLSKCRRIWPSA